jgi:hypothetical protein
MGFAPLSTRRIVTLDSLVRSLAVWQRSGLPIPAQRRLAGRRRPNLRPVPSVAALAAEA